jgi:hypothetical protein
VAVIPTLCVLEVATGTPGSAELATDPRLSPYLAPDWRAALTRGSDHFYGHPAVAPRLEHAARATLLLREAGVPILAGTDAPLRTAYGLSIHRELALLVAAGLSPTEALAAATSAPARCFGLADRGWIGPGRRADLVLVDGDPTVDVTATRAIARRVAPGRAVRPRGVPEEDRGDGVAAQVPASGSRSAPSWRRIRRATAMADA